MPQPAPARVPRRSILRRLALGVLALLIAGGLAGELAARFWFGLGDPPLYRLDPEVEYLLVPGRTYHRMGHVFSVNGYSMRSPDFPRTKGQGELRVLVVGDSIVNGGARIDQRELATELLRDRLQRSLGRPVVVGNFSASSWGPPNELALIRKFGTFDADVVILVLNSDDLTDVPGIEGIGAQWPQHTPTFALEEVWDRAVTPWLERATGRSFGPAPKRAPDPEKDKVECLDAAKDFFALVRSDHAQVALVQYLTRNEVVGAPQEGYARFRDMAARAGVSAYSTGDSFRASLDAGRDPYLPGDGVHPSATGQELLAKTLERAVLDLPAAHAGQSRPGATGATR